jgi:transposase
LATAYYLKEELRQLWAQADKAAAEAFMENWIARAQASGIGRLRSLAKTLRRHKEGLLANYDYPLSTGPLEGTNDKVRALQRQAYGYRDLEFFWLKLMALHEAKYALVG